MSTFGPKLKKFEKASFFQYGIALSIFDQSGSTIAQINRLDEYN